jgi:hypothetical protein
MAVANPSNYRAGINLENVVSVRLAWIFESKKQGSWAISASERAILSLSGQFWLSILGAYT